MYIRTISRKNKDGSEVRYVQLAHNYRDKEAGHAKAKVLYNFGREENADKEALRRLVKSINRFLGPEDALINQAGEALKFLSSRPIGVEQVKHDLTGWRLGRVITVLDRGFVSEDNLKTLQQAGGHYIVGEKLRGGKACTRQALSTAGRYQKVKDNLEVKEIIVGDGEGRKRYILVRNPLQADRDKKHREKVLAQLKEELAQAGASKGGSHNKACCRLLTHPAYGRYLKTLTTGEVKIDPVKVKEEEKLDGKYLLKTSDDTIAAEDVALGYKQLAEVEAAFKTLKSTLELRPVYHRLEERIRAHVLLCWLALLMVRVAEKETGETWPNIKRQLQQIHLGEFEGPKGYVCQRTELAGKQISYFKALKLDQPPQFMEITTKRS